MQERQPKFARSIVALLTLVCWVFASNHCAIITASEMATSGRSRHCCEKQQKHSSQNQFPTCCKQVTKLVQLKSSFKQFASYSVLYILPTEVSSAESPGQILEGQPQDAGPPRSQFYFQIQSKRCRISNAPPLFV